NVQTAEPSKDAISNIYAVLHGSRRRPSAGVPSLEQWDTDGETLTNSGLCRGASRRNTRSDRRPKTKARAHVVNGDPRNGSTIVGTPAFRLSPADADPNGSPERQPAAHAGRPEPH